MNHPMVSGILLGLAVVLAIACAVGVLVMRDAFQRLHFSAPVVSFSVLFIGVAVWLEDTDPQARIKIILIGLILFVMNSILTHATGKAIRIRQAGKWDPTPDEKIPIVGRQGFAGEGHGDRDHEAQP